MSSSDSLDSIRLVGTLLRVVRLLDSELRSTPGNALDLGELSVLGSIARGVIAPSMIARTLSIDPPRVTRMVDQLVVRGYVTRGSDPLDRRRCPLSLTEEGRRALEAGRQVLTDVTEDLLRRLRPTDRRHVVEGMTSLREILDQPATKVMEPRLAG
ncbi:MAG TPA: MarR family transcriptional regulator [Chloroflexota bacterium]|nr:MarR family transcriptional regulator [Chloroflexota bacterium]